MSEPRTLYVNSIYFKTLYEDIVHLERQIHHDIDNYEDGMSAELVEALKVLEKASRMTKKRMQLEREKHL